MGWRPSALRAHQWVGLQTPFEGDQSRLQDRVSRILTGSPLTKPRSGSQRWKPSIGGALHWGSVDGTSALRERLCSDFFFTVSLKKERRRALQWSPLEFTWRPGCEGDR